MPAPDYASEIATLESALAGGEAEIENPDGSRVKYRTMSEIKAGIAYFQGKAREANAGGAAPRTTYATFGRD